MPAKYLNLSGEALLESVVTLCNRIQARFPTANLCRIAQTVREVTARAHERAVELRKPNIPLRAAVAALVIGMVTALVAMGRNIALSLEEVQKAPAFVQFFEAALNIVVVLGGASIFVATLERRIKRNKVLKAVHELRSLAHIIDMHQLTKVPDHYLPAANRTQFTPEPKYTAFELSRYLDYCSELLALVGKIGVLYVEHLSDPVVLDAVDQIEDLTDGLSRKIWQKLTVLTRVTAGMTAEELAVAPHLPLAPPASVYPELGLLS
jgi:hypothetical protein